VSPLNAVWAGKLLDALRECREHAQALETDKARLITDNEYWHMRVSRLQRALDGAEDAIKKLKEEADDPPPTPV